jgi:von Willebrand factor type A domain
MLYTIQSISRNIIMKSILLTLLLTCFFGTFESLRANDTKEVYTVPANSGNIISSFITNPKSTYTITVQGNYSLAGEAIVIDTNKNTKDTIKTVRGDGFAIYYVDDLVNTNIWPKQIQMDTNSAQNPVKIDTTVFYPLPLLFTNTNTYPTLAQIASNKIQTRINTNKHLGFRFNGRVIPVNGYAQNNRYQFQVSGNGNPFTMQILDSVDFLILERVLPGYADNEGALTVTIEETVVQFCEDPKPVFDKDSVLIALDISLGVFIEDSNSVTGKTNLLSEASDLAVFHKIKGAKDTSKSLIDSSFFVCPQSIICDKPKDRGVALAMVLDRSGSMLDNISPVDSRIRINEAKNASTQFVDRLGDKDESMIISFADDSRVDQTWTNNKSALKNAINSLIPTGFTAMNEGVIRAIDSIRKHPNPNRAIILLSDGGNNRWPEFNAVVNKLKEDTINPLPIYSIALGLNRNDPLDLAGLNDLKELARLTKGKTFEVYSAGSLDSVYQQLTKEVVNDRCCVLRVPVPPCAGPSDTLRTIKVMMPVNGKVEINTITYRPNCAKVKDTVISSLHDSNIFVYRGEDAQPVSELMPNPSNGQATLGYEVSRYGNVSIDIYAQDGSLVRSILNAPQDQGRYKIAIDMTSEVQGYYSVIIKIDGLTIMRPMIITK